MTKTILALSTLGLLASLLNAHQQGVLVNPGGTPAQAATASTRPHLFDPSRDAKKDIADGVKLAAKQHKRVLIDVGGDWCPWCHKLDGTFHKDAEIAKFLSEKYVVVKVNFSPENENKEVLSKFPKIPGYPHLFVLDSTGKLLQSQDTGLLETGDHHDHDKVMAFLKKWSG
jgi:thioredoxin-related protein